MQTGTFGFSVPLAALFDGAWSSGPRGIETYDFGDRSETACSGIKICLCAEGKWFDVGVTSICIRGVGLELVFWGEQRQSMGEGFEPHDNSNNYVYQFILLVRDARHNIGCAYWHYAPLLQPFLPWRMKRKHMFGWGERAICASFPIFTFPLHIQFAWRLIIYVFPGCWQVACFCRRWKVWKKLVWNLI